MTEPVKTFTNECKFDWTPGEKVEGLLSGVEVMNTKYGDTVILEIEGEARLHRVVTSNSLIRRILDEVHVGDDISIEYGGREVKDDPDSKKVFIVGLLSYGELKIPLRQVLEDCGFDFKAAKMERSGGVDNGA